MIPPARRHQLVNWNLETIPQFAFGNLTLAAQLKEMMKDNQIFGYQNGDQLSPSPIRFSYQIFDKKPRGLVNVYYHIYQLNQLLASPDYIKAEAEEKNKRKFIYVKALIDTIILSSNALAGNQHQFFNELLLWGDDAGSTTIKYDTDKLPKEMLIIGEMIKTLLPDVNFDKDNFIKMKEALFQDMALHENDVDLKKSLIGQWQYPLYYVVKTIIGLLNPRAALLLLEFLSSASQDRFYYRDSSAADRYGKDKNFITAIGRLAAEESDVFQQLYHFSHNEKRVDVSISLRMIRELCSVSTEYAMTENIFKPIIHWTVKSS